MAFLESQYSNQVQAQLAQDLVAPGQVTGLAYVVAQGRVNLTWDAVTLDAEGAELLDLAGYRIFRKAQAGDAFELIGSVGAAELAFADTTAKDGASLIYAVAAIDDADLINEGEKSADLLVKTIPSVPSGLQASATEEAIVLNWLSVKDEQDAKLNENLAGYNVYRSEVDGSGYVKVGTAGAGELTFSDEAAVVGTTYFYVITAFDNSN